MWITNFFPMVLCAVIAQTIHAQSTLEIQKHFEFENVLTDLQSDLWMWRSEASEKRTLRLEDEEGVYRVALNLCLEQYNATKNITMYVDDVRYSNDGPPDTVSVYFDDNFIGNFTTFERWRSGHEWNIFRNSGRVGATVNVLPGEYVLLITVVTDKWGVELDRIRINLENQDPTKDIFCGASVYSVN